MVTPVAFDAVGSGSFTIGANTSTALAALTFAATVAPSANCIAVPLVCWDNGVSGSGAGTHSRTVAYNGVSLTSGTAFDNVSNNGFIEWWYLLNPPGGTFDGSPHNVVVNVTRLSTAAAGTWAITADSISAKNVGTVTIGAGQGPASGTPSVSVASNANSISLGCIGTTVNDPGGYNQTQRSLITTSNFSFGFAAISRMGSAAGASPTVTHSESAAGNVFVAQAINLGP